MPESAGRKHCGDPEEKSRRLVFRTASRTEEFFDRLEAHFRECRRRNVEAGGDVEIVLEDGSVFDTGTARVTNVSATGALLAGVKLGKGAYPAARFSVEVRLTTGPYRGVGFRATPVRFVHEEDGIGVRFDELFIAGDREENPPGAGT